MKEFFKFTFASMLGFFLAAFVFIIFSVFLVMAVVSASSNDEVKISDNSILELKLNKPISDRTPSMPEDIFDLESFKIQPGLNDIISMMRKAKDDERIEGIYLNLGNVPGDISTLSEVRDAILDFKSSGKFVYAYASTYSQTAYYLASVADKVFLHPEGQMLFKGLMAQPMFFKGALEKLGVEAQIIRHGKYKSAIEPFILEKMSEASREQVEEFVGDLWDQLLLEIGESRNIGVSELNRIADELLALDPEKALELGLVDDLLYTDEMHALLSEEIEVEHLKKSNLLSIYKYNKDKSNRSKFGHDKIALIYANGSINNGEGNGDNRDIYGTDLSRVLRKARLDDKVKAVLFRVNSPGGDALASDIILREVKLLAEQKPVVVSMGTYAASGGYYISCGADYIFANELTLTGSIGVFGVIPNMQELLNEKLGITLDEVKTNKNADYIDVFKAMSEDHRNALTYQIEDIYQTFIEHVAEGRSMTTDAVDAIGQGRVWSGTDALEIGLIDELGGLTAALNKTIELSGSEDYRIIEWPEQLEPLEAIMKDLTGETSSKILEKEMGTYFTYWETLNDLRDMEGVQARVPFVLSVK